ASGTPPRLSAPPCASVHLRIETPFLPTLSRLPRPCGIDSGRTGETGHAGSKGWPIPEPEGPFPDVARAPMAPPMVEQPAREGDQAHPARWETEPWESGSRCAT